MCNPITSVSGNVQSQLPSCKWKGEKPGEHSRYLGKSVHGEILSRCVTAELPHIPSRTCGYRHTHSASAVSRNSWLHTEALPQPVCPACPGRCTSEQLVHSHKHFWASPFMEIGFTVEVTWTCSWGKPRQESLHAAHWHFWARSQEVKTQGQRTADTIPCCTWGWSNQHIPNQPLIP